MKIRAGFVSNSSSTSYTVAFVPEPSDLNMKTFDFLLSSMGNRTHPVNFKVFRDTVDNRRKTLEEEIKTSERDLSWAKERSDKLFECSQIPAIQLLMTELDDIGALNSDIIRHARRNDKKEKWLDAIRGRIVRYGTIMKELTVKIAEAQDQLNLIKDLPGESIVAKWEEDCGAAHMLSDLLDVLEPDGRVIILEKEIT